MSEEKITHHIHRYALLAHGLFLVLIDNAVVVLVVAAKVHIHPHGDAIIRCAGDGTVETANEEIERG